MFGGRFEVGRPGVLWKTLPLKQGAAVLQSSLKKLFSPSLRLKHETGREDVSTLFIATVYVRAVPVSEEQWSPPPSLHKVLRLQNVRAQEQRERKEPFGGNLGLAHVERAFTRKHGSGRFLITCGHFLSLRHETMTLSQTKDTKRKPGRIQPADKQPLATCAAASEPKI
ncbi:unnamed protein product [Pleuronectes platessa]|uniref:Uncharacterized protein n=1 Tax=Pleuronectes platessa TaxID=8262 RepID=A0A9N7YIB0_PLEPL|nr:unnamed protein product [Pleuronectes platessa]